MVYILSTLVHDDNVIKRSQELKIFFVVVCFFSVIPQLLNFICRRFGTLCLFHFHRQVGACRMNSAEDMFGVLYGKRFDLEMA